MAGANKLLKQGQVLFKAGDPSDGLYLIRKDELLVYLEQNGKKVILTHLGPGAMVGEMAIFDRKPRSAFVRATKDAEVTLISSDDFTKLMKQIPGWFGTLMSSLSERLRSTNERLQRMEAGTANGNPYQSALRVMHLLNLLWHKDGKKEGSSSIIEKTPVEKTLCETLDLVPEKLRVFMDALIQTKILMIKPDSYNNQCLVMASRGILDRLIEFTTKFSKSNKDLPVLPESALRILQAMAAASKGSPYDDLTLNLDQIVTKGRELKFNTDDWPTIIPQLRNVAEGVITMTRVSDKEEGFRIDKKQIDHVVVFHHALAAIYRANL